MKLFTEGDFISKIAPVAVSIMNETNIPASLIIAQSFLESAYGNSELVEKANNLFGIKGTGTAGYVIMSTIEFEEGQGKLTQAVFRKYNNWEESFNDYSNLILNGVSWDRNKYRSVINKDGITACEEMGKSGYATDPEYGNKLIKIVKTYDLLQYDFHNTKLEISAIQTLEEKIRYVINELTLISQRLEEIPPPKWFLEEFPEAVDHLHQKTGSVDFWRAYTMTLRIYKNLKNS